MKPLAICRACSLLGNELTLEGFTTTQKRKLATTLARAPVVRDAHGEAPATLSYEGTLALDAFGSSRAVATPLPGGRLWRAIAPSWRADFDPLTKRFALWTSTPAVFDGAIATLDILWLPAFVSLEARGGLFLHALSFVHAGRAFILAGRSGTGKTTLSRRIEHAHRLSDDRAIVDPVPNGFRVLPSPFSGREGLPVGSNEAPLAGVAVLEQSPTDHVERLRPAEAFASLFEHQVPSRAPWATSRNPLAPLGRLVERIPCYRVGFTRDSDPVWIAEQMMARARP